MKERDDVNEENLLEMLEEYRLARLARAQEEMKEVCKQTIETGQTLNFSSNPEQRCKSFDLNGRFLLHRFN